jgi:adenylate cyclase
MDEGRAGAVAVPQRRWPAFLTSSRLRLASGLWLLLFAATHLLNHALGLVSLSAAEAGREVFLAFWRLAPVEASLVLALLVHLGLGLHKLWQRRTWSLTLVEALQLALGLLIPVYLTGHMLGTGWMHRCCGVTDSYAYLLNNVWPDGAWRQTVLTLTVWLHGMIGMHQWLRLRPGYRRVQPWLLITATILPLTALMGFVSAGREVATLRQVDPAGWAALAEAQNWPRTAAVRELWAQRPARLIVDGFLFLVAAVLALRVLRWLWQRRRHVRLSYPGGREVSIPRGLSVLDASRLNNIPHAAVCGGRGRCSTCRVRVGRDHKLLPPPSPEEQRVLARIGATPDVRLACQLRPTAPLAVTPLMPATATPRHALELMSPAQGIEREIAVLFADLRDFTRLSEGRLPYDTVFILNRYFKAMGEAVEATGGRVDKFIGDGIMALFGVDDPPGVAARTALSATRAMALALEGLNRDLAVELDEPLRMGMGLHLGHAILGEMGGGRTRALTAIGDTVNVASRLEALTKEFGCQLVVSESIAAFADGALDGCPRQEVDVRGRAGRLTVRLVENAATLPEPARGGRRERRPWRLSRLRLPGPTGMRLPDPQPPARW